MSDQNKYINTYVDVTVGTVHELLNQVLQLKTEARIANDLVSEKSQVISSLQEEQQKSQIGHEQIEKAHEQARLLESELSSLKNKASNFDVLSNQFNELKRDFIAKTNEVDSIKIEYEEKLNNVQKELEQTKDKLKELQKIDRQVKKEEKKSQQVVVKPIINKETTPVAKSIPAKVVVKEAEEDNDF